MLLPCGGRVFAVGLLVRSHTVIGLLRLLHDFALVVVVRGVIVSRDGTSRWQHHTVIIHRPVRIRVLVLRGLRLE